MAAPNDTKLFDSVGYWQKGRLSRCDPRRQLRFRFEWERNVIQQKPLLRNRKTAPSKLGVCITEQGSSPCTL